MSRTPRPGISGFALRLPPLRVQLERWCQWNDANWNKVRAVAGSSFRMLSPRESVYTLAADAVLELIERYDIDPQTVGMLALGTESSTDNAAGAVIVRGLVDAALAQKGAPLISSQCEVPELKHACLGGIYALKNAARYVAFDGQQRCAIVVCVDIAEYARGSSGEQTQGAGAVAMLVEAEPKLLELDLSRTGTSSAYRGPDFRKPVRRFTFDDYDAGRLHDFPVFNGRYSTFCYLDAVARAAEAMAGHLDTTLLELLEQQADAVFFHRPYHHMPVQALASLYVRALLAADTAEANAVLEPLAAEAGVDLAAARAELELPLRPFQPLDEASIGHDPTPAQSGLARLVRRSDAFKALRSQRMDLGVEAMKHCGNMYTAALPAWLAAGLDDALQRDLDLADHTIVAIGYGSGDAAEAIPMRVVPGWQEAARRIDFTAALDGAVDLDQSQYEALHDGLPVDGLDAVPARNAFVVERIGEANGSRFQDIGLEYYGRVD